MSSKNPTRPDRSDSTSRRGGRQLDCTRPSVPTYDRSRDLPRLIQIWPEQLTGTNPIDRHIILRKLYAALRAERQRGRLKHWTYDVARHSQLLIAYRRELEHIKKARPHPKARAQQSDPSAQPDTDRKGD